MKSLLTGAFIALLLVGLALLAAVHAGVAVIGQPVERCLLGFPNSDAPGAVELIGTGAYDVCDNLSNPIRALNSLQGMSVLATPLSGLPPPWNRLRPACHFDRYGLAWTLWLPPNWPAVDAYGNKQDCATLAARY